MLEIVNAQLRQDAFVHRSGFMNKERNVEEYNS